MTFRLQGIVIEHDIEQGDLELASIINNFGPTDPGPHDNPRCAKHQIPWLSGICDCVSMDFVKRCACPFCEEHGKYEWPCPFIVESTATQITKSDTGIFAKPPEPQRARRRLRVSRFEPGTHYYLRFPEVMSDMGLFPDRATDNTFATVADARAAADAMGYDLADTVLVVHVTGETSTEPLETG